MGKHLAINMVKNLFIVLQKSTTDVIKTASKRAIQKTAEATGDLIGNIIADKITSVSKTFSTKLHYTKLQNDNPHDELEVTKKRYISPEERQQIID